MISLRDAMKDGLVLINPRNQTTCSHKDSISETFFQKAVTRSYSGKMPFYLQSLVTWIRKLQITNVDGTTLISLQNMLLEIESDIALF